MAKVRYHLAPHGPDICRVDPTNPRSKGCPFGGQSGSENHFDTMAEAASAYEQKMEAEGNGLIIPPATATPEPLTVPPLPSYLEEKARKDLNELMADGYYGISRDPRLGLVADSSEGLQRLRSEFMARLDNEVDPEIDFGSEPETGVIQSIYIRELNIEIQNQNYEMDREEISRYGSMKHG